MKENMKKRGFVALFLVICISLIFVSCSAESTSGKGSLTSLTVENPGVLAYKEDKRVALVDHTYTVNNYKVYANYSTGYREDVTQVAKITTNDSFVEIGNDKSIKFKQKGEGNSYSLTVQYGTITLPVTAWAYVPGEPIDGLRNVRTTFYKGELLSSFAGISEIEENGNYYSSSILPSSANVLFLAKTSEGGVELYSVNPNSTYAFTGNEQLMYYVTVASDGTLSSVTFIDGFEVVDYTADEIEKLQLGLLKKYPVIGENILSSDELIKKYLPGQKSRVTLKNKASFTRLLVNDDGTISDSSFAIECKVTNAKGEEKTSGTFELSDTLTVTVKFGSVVLCERKYSVARNDYSKEI